MIADSVQENKQMITSIDPNAKIFIWSDMFDPYQFNLDNFFAVNGSINGSYKGLSDDITVVNWNFGPNYKASLQFFENNGNPQILAGYYDGSCMPIDQWLDSARPAVRVDGVMYTTWKGDYSNLEEFAMQAWGDNNTINASYKPTSVIEQKL